jgi:hypothetical protein
MRVKRVTAYCGAPRDRSGDDVCDPDFFRFGPNSQVERPRASSQLSVSFPETSHD